MMIFDEGGGCLAVLIGIAIVASIIAACVALAIIAIIGVATVGAVAGVVIAVIHYVMAIIETSKERKRLLHCKDGASLANVRERDNSDLIFEENAAKMYIVGPIFKDILEIIKEAFCLNFENGMDFSDTSKDSALATAAAVIFTIGKGISVYVFGTIFTIILTLIFAALCAVLMAVTYPIIGVILLIETIYFKAKQINFRCPVCKKEYKIPAYLCPECGISHIRLKPGRYGLFRRRCLCGAHLPLVAKVNGYIKKYDSTGSRYKSTIKFGDLHSTCPHCGNENNVGLSHAISIALVGGTSAGKTTFKVAFQYEFLENETERLGVDFSFPDESSEDEFKKSRRYFEGRDFIPATNASALADITTFCVKLSHKSFLSDRLLQIYDLPGERFMSGDVKESWEHYSFTEGAVFLIDPYSLESVKKQNDDELQGSSMGICSADMNEMIDQMIATLNNVKVKKNRNGKITIPIALAISKVDTDNLSEQCGEKAAEKLLAGAPGVFKDKFEAMDYACRCFLSINGFDGFIQNLDNNFETVHFFSCSAVGYIPKQRMIKYAPKNVLEIMRWMIVRADKKNIGGVWRSDIAASDVPDDRKTLYRTNRSYYDELILNTVNT